MKIKIIKDLATENNSEIHITKFIGKTFEAKLSRMNSVDVDFGEDLGILTVYEGEYEVIES